MKRTWYATPEGRAKGIARAQAAHIRRADLPGTYSPEAWLARQEELGFRCFHCGDDLPSGTETVDHLVPVSKPGSSHWIDNLVPACGTCNSSRHNKTVAEFRAYRHELGLPVRLDEATERILADA